MIFRADYLTGSKAFSSEGYHPTIKVDLSGGFFRDYDIPYIASQEAIIEGITSALRILELAPDYIAFPILTAPFLGIMAGIAPSRCSLFFHGSSGSGKSSCAGIILGFFGKNLDEHNLTESYASTLASLESMVSQTNGVTSVVDDRVAKTSVGNLKALNSKDEAIYRAQGNGQVRNKFNQKHTQKPSGLLVGTGEHPITGESLVARTLVIPQKKTALNSAILDELKTASKKGDFIACSSGFIQWVTSQDGDLKSQIEKRRSEITKSLNYLKNIHSLTPKNVAEFLTALELFLESAVTCGAITQDVAGDLLERGEKAFIELAEKQRMYLVDGTAKQYIFALKNAIVTKKCHLLDINSSHPATLEKWGWAQESENTMQWSPRGEHIGWIDDQDVYILSEEAHKIYQSAMNSTFGGASVKDKTANKHLNEAGHLKTRGSDGYTIRKSINGNRTRVLHMDANLLS